jgi:tRNA A-37 threonylcarbamoyl transferase component Bud32
MGAVFKARNWKLGRIVALKLIRKERLDSPEAVRRFQREVRAAAALDHPNIVHALDADEIRGTHLLVMEYVEGAIDLARLVKANGPLPVAQACEFIRQAALGLQHACDRGLVHRDIKPHNLLLTADGTLVKVLDMGLARLDQSAPEDESSTMTQDGMVMGTPDYIAPEQAVESHTVDIRADLYSLGCTFYYLLTGQVPFPGGTFIQKINKHQFEQPQPLEQVRPGVPPGVAGVVRKLMAKLPSARYQTPAELAAVLAAGASAGPQDSRARPVAPVDSGETVGETAPTGFTDLNLGEPAASPDLPARVRQPRRGRHRLWLRTGVGLLLLLLGMAALLYLFVGRDSHREGEPTPGAAAVVPGHTPRDSRPKVPTVAHDAVGARVTIVPDQAGHPGPGARGLADGLLAEGDEATSAGWVGWQRGVGPVEVTLDLVRPTKVTKLGAHFLRAVGVALPTRVEFAVSEDGKEFRMVAALSEGDGVGQRGWYTAVVEAVTARRVRVRATPGADWMFLDEVAVNPPPEAPHLRHAALGRPVTLAFPPGGGYTAPGVQGLTDGFVGRSPDFLNLQWLGVEARNLDATIDLGRVLEVREVGAHFLQYVRVGIRLPTALDVLVSGDGKEFRTVGAVKPVPDERLVYRKTLSVKLDGVTGRFVRVVGYNGGSWLFADEVFVNPEPGVGRQVLE